MKLPFRRKGYEVTLNRVHDNILIREGGETLSLAVNGDAMRIVAGLNKAQKMMTDLKESDTDEKARETALYFASVIFGREQAGKLLEFYAEDAACVIAVCGKYFQERLAGKISEVQKKMKA